MQKKHSPAIATQLICGPEMLLWPFEEERRRR